MTTDRDEAIAEQLRAILGRSKRWAAEVDGLSLKAIAAQDPLDLTGCTDAEAVAIARWALEDAREMPERLRRYLATVRG